MPNYTLYRTVCSTDWKGRPHHSIELLAVSDDPTWLVNVQDQDVVEWQEEDVALYNEAYGEEDEPRTAWEIKNQCFEMEGRGKNGERSFVQKDEGDICTTVYHIKENRLVPRVPFSGPSNIELAS
jgi:hypothetical protein